jgi:2'-5' RNA ligase
MTPDRMQYYIYVALPARLSRRVAAIRQKYPGTFRSDPHLTLVIPRTIAPGRSERELVRALRDATASLSPYEIRYSGVSFFGSRDFVYVPVYKTHPLRECRDACVRAVRGILEDGRLDRFRHPHITLAGRLPPEDGLRVWQALEGKTFDGRFRCREVSLMRMNATDRQWRLVARCRLGGR